MGDEMGFWELGGIRRRYLQATIAAAALFVPAAATAGASAATLAVNKPCYVNKFTKTSIRLAPMQVTGSGYVPNDPVTITSSDGSLNKLVQANSAGMIDASIGAPTPFFKLPASLPLTLTASDFSQSNGTITGAHVGQGDRSRGRHRALDRSAGAPSDLVLLGL